MPSSFSSKIKHKSYNIFTFKYLFVDKSFTKLYNVVDLFAALEQKEQNMKKTLKYLLFTLLTLTLVLCLFSCRGKEEDPGCPSHLDTTGDGLCETCGAEAETKIDESEYEITLIQDGEIKFRIVKAADINAGTRLAMDALVKKIKKLDSQLDVVEDTASTIKDDGVVEILVGTVTSRGEEYMIDPHTLGLEGQVLKQINGKIILQAGTPNLLEEMFNSFVEDVLKIDDDTDELKNAKTKKKHFTEYIQNDYDILSYSIDGNDLKGYTIAVDENDADFKPFAEKIQTDLYKLAGYWLPIVSLDKASEKSIVLAVREKDSTPEDSFRIYTKGATLYIESEYTNCISTEMDLFIAKNITAKTGKVDIKGSITKKDVSVVRYEDFGAKGDGRTNDYGAIKKAHDYANEGGQRILGKATATYYISKTGGKAISIKTPTDWNGAKFIIDDSDLHETTHMTEIKNSIFKIESYVTMPKISAAKIAEINAGEKLGPKTTKIDTGIGMPALLSIINKDHRVYVRYGGNADAGAEQHELVVVDAEGNIQPGTELMLDYEKVTSIVAYSVEDEYMEVKNATFTTLATRQSTTVVENGKKIQYGTYFRRNIEIARSNTTLLNIAHYAEGEFTVAEQNAGQTGACYVGFYHTVYANNVTFRDCIMTGRRYYKINGTYDFGANMSNNVLLENCQQPNYYKADGETLSTAGAEYWGIGGTSYCKNITYKDSRLSRFDAHAGLYNGNIINSQVGWLALTGGGTMLIDDSLIEDSKLFGLRTDYGSTWNGTVIVKDTLLKNKLSMGVITDVLWTNHDFGYTCCFPNIILDNVGHSNSNVFDLVITSDDTDLNKDTIQSWGDYIHIPGVEREEYEAEPKAKEDDPDVINKVNVNPMRPPEYLIIKNCPGVTFNLIYKKCFENTTIRGFTSFPKYDPDEDLGIALPY